MKEVMGALFRTVNFVFSISGEIGIVHLLPFTHNGRLSQ